MNFLTISFNIILYRPLLNALVVIYEAIPGHDFGMAIIILTLLIRVLLYPSTLKSIKSQKAIQEIQPKMKEIQAKFKDDKEKQGRAIMELYKREKVNPLSGCLPLLVQFPILIALFIVLKNLSSGSIDGGVLYSFIPHPGAINPIFLGIINITQSAAVKVNQTVQYLWPNIILIFLAGVFQFFQTKMITPKNKKFSGKQNDFSQIMQKQMLYFFPIFTILILWKLLSAIALYWLTTSLFSIGQQRLAFKNKNV